MTSADMAYIYTEQCVSDSIIHQYIHNLLSKLEDRLQRPSVELKSLHRLL